MTATLVAHGVAGGHLPHTLSDSLDLSIPAGDVLGVVGPNGAGKSTLLRAVLNQQLPDEGAASLGGERLEQRNRPGAVPARWGRQLAGRCPGVDPGAERE